ncbi:MAG: phosphoribosylaminoimidazolesuccinocarboxamide synthase [Candidatus Marinimicrobia bacterium]|nr:phosphoribosylaminoimidazolesuccinocarboxamide synthase [Candidatus Neomarinimicrobiota bacterium]
MKDIITTQLDKTLNNSIADLENLGRHYRGKVRDNYYFDNQILMVTSDRVSAFDHVLGTIPFKGQILSEIASFWFDKTKEIVPNHFIKSIDPQVLLVKEAKPLPVEVIVRRYITGSLWRDYENSKHHVYDLDFGDNLKKNQRFSSAMLTPSTKEDYGKHDMPISRKEIINQKLVDKEIYEKAEEYALALFAEGEKWAKKQGLILVDTKYEFGLVDGELIVIDEIHTPDSSRYWIESEYEKRFAAGEDQLMLDKENMRQWLISKGFSGEGTPPELEDDIRILLSEKYMELYKILTGKDFIPSSGDVSNRIQNNIKNAGF